MPAKFICTEGRLCGQSVAVEQGQACNVDFGGGESPQVEVEYVAEGWCLRSDANLSINGSYERDYILKSGDEIYCNESIFLFESDEIVSLDLDEPISSETDFESNDVDDEHGRRGRRLSATHDAVIHGPAQQKRGILERVGQALRRKDEKVEKLEELELQRQSILHQAGRFVLEYQGGLGLPPDFMMSLFRGEAVTVEPHQLVRVELERFRILRDRLIHLDSAINVCRISMGLEEEDRNPIYDLSLRKDIETEEDQAYEAMDDMATIEHEHDIASFSQNTDMYIDDDETQDARRSRSAKEQTEFISHKDTHAALNDQEDVQAPRSSARRRTVSGRGRTRRRR